MRARSQHRQHAGEDLEPQVLFVTEAVGATLEHADLVVQPLDEAERDLVLRAAVTGDAARTRARTRACGPGRARRPDGAGRGTCRTGGRPAGRAARSPGERASTCP